MRLPRSSRRHAFGFLPRIVAARCQAMSRLLRLAMREFSELGLKSNQGRTLPLRVRRISGSAPGRQAATLYDARVPTMRAISAGARLLGHVWTRAAPSRLVCPSAPKSSAPRAHLLDGRVWPYIVPMAASDSARIHRDGRVARMVAACLSAACRTGAIRLDWHRAALRRFDRRPRCASRNLRYRRAAARSS